MADKKEKSAAKKALKANITENEAVEEQKEYTNKSAKAEKRRLQRRAEKLELKAQKLLIEAQKARERADILKNIKAADTEESASSSSDENDDTNPSAAKPTNDHNSPTSSENKSDDDEPIATTPAKEHKKSKKTNKSKAREMNDDETNREKNPKDKLVDKKEKKRKREETQSTTEPVVTQEKKVKKSKKDKSDAGYDTNHTGSNWNAEALEGGDKRKEKFKRLLGGGKAGGAMAASGSAPSRSKNDIAHMQQEMERQFDLGMKMKHDGQGHRRGLGA